MHRPRKRFGQHFLHDPAVIRRIVAAVDPRPGQAVVEIGPGLGALTGALLERVGRLEVIELDRDLLPALQAACAGRGELRVHQADALRVDYCALLPPGGAAKLRLVGNLPYNISTPLLFHLIDQMGCIADMHFMLQKEVVDRLAAALGSADYGRLSVMVQYHCAVQRLFNVGPGAFRPPPRVESAVVRLQPHAEAPVRVADPRQLSRLVARCFSQRRKTLRNSLKGVLEPGEIQALGIDPGLRPERLTLAQFAALTNAAAVHGDAD